MHVRITKKGYAVDIPIGYKYTKSKNIPWLGADAEDLLPIHKINKGRNRY
jgi:hypothetical protein